MNVEIISVGSELLHGDICNTNAQELSKELALLGCNVFHHTVVGDNKSRLLEVLEVAKNRSNVIITTGGLGPTYDDLTKEIVVKSFDLPLVFNEKAYNNIEEYFVKNNKKVTSSQKKQAMLPLDSVPFYNNCGTAPGCAFFAMDTHVLMLPGPPKECMTMFSNSAKEYLLRYSKDVILSENLKVYGLGEAYISELLHDKISQYKNPSIATYAKEFECHIRITAKASCENTAESMLLHVKQEIYDILGESIYSEDEKDLHEVSISRLLEKNITISCAESCTGGLFSKFITDVSGVSEIFKGSVCSYSNDAKMNILGVSGTSLEKHGAVSEQVAREMAFGAVRLFDTDLAVSITGVAGPLGGSLEKPLGLVYVCVYYNNEYFIEKIDGYISRDTTRNKACLCAFNLIRNIIK